AVGAVREAVGERMADKAGVHAIAGVDWGFHWKQAEHAIGDAAHALRAFATPGPYGRAHIVDRAHAGALQPPFHAEIEVGRVDADENVGLPGEQAADQVAPEAEQAWQMAQYLRQTHDRQWCIVGPQLDAGGPHVPAADAGEVRVGPE